MRTRSFTAVARATELDVAYGPGMGPAERLLVGKCCLVTGGSRGLGRAMCVEFARQGAEVAFTYRADVAAAQQTLAALEAVGQPGVAFQVSVLDGPGTRRYLAQLLERWPGIDILVNNAAVTHNLPLALLDEADWDEVMDTNVKGAFLTTRAVVRGMLRRKTGVILNIGSLAGVRMIQAPVHYYTSKAAIRGFTEVLAKEVAPAGIRVNCLAPGLLEGGVGDLLPEHRRADYLQHCALGRRGTFEEVARLAAFVVSEQNTYMSGATVVVDGGV